MKAEINYDWRTVTFVGSYSFTEIKKYFEEKGIDDFKVRILDDVIISEENMHVTRKNICNLTQA